MEEMVIPEELAVEPAVDADAAAKHDQQEDRRWHLALHKVLNRMNTLALVRSWYVCTPCNRERMMC